MEELGNKIRLWRKQNKISQRELAQRLGCSVHSIVEWEKGTNYPGVWALGLLADEMCCSVDWLLGRTI